MKYTPAERAALLDQAAQNAHDLTMIIFIGALVIIALWSLIFFGVEYSMRRWFWSKVTPLRTAFTKRCEARWNKTLDDLRFENMIGEVFSDREYEEREA